MLEEVRRRHWSGFDSSEEENNPPSPSPTISTQLSDDDIQLESMRTVVLSDQQMLDRARAAHGKVDFESLSAGPEANGPWKRVEAVNRFVVFRRHVTAGNNDKRSNGLEVMCAGRLDASLEEVASILQSNTEAEHNASMNAMYTNSFIFGSYEREISCSGNNDHHDTTCGEQLAVKTKSFTRTTMFGHNEQWCYFDYFQRKKERDGFTITKRALTPLETTPGRITGDNSRVDQLHGLNTSHLVDKLPNPCPKKLEAQKPGKYEPQCNLESEFAPPFIYIRRFAYGDANKHKVLLRRLLSMAHGVTKLPELIRRRRFGVQVPANLEAIQTSNSRCPCCTHSLAPVKLSLSKAASAITTRSLASLKMDTRRCYLCGYLVCVDCWTAEHLENVAGRVAAIVVCTRCHANVQACEYSEVFAGTAAEREQHRGPPRVVEDSNNAPTVALLVDFLSASLLNSCAGSREHAVVMEVIRSLLRQNEEDSNEEEENNAEYDNDIPRFKVLEDQEAVTKLGEVLNDEERLPSLEACKLGNAHQRNYPLDLPDDPTVDVPHSPIPSNESDRITSIKAAGLLKFADIFAPEFPHTDVTNVTAKAPNVQDLELLCNLAVKTLECAYSFVTIMCKKHEHVVVGTHPGFVGAAVPREQTTCQHALMSPYPFIVAHHEADVRFHKMGATSAIPQRFYVGFPLKVPVLGGNPNDEQLTVGMLCCIDSKPRAIITRTQYATMERLASTASYFLLLKSRQLL
ncbi:Hypothetical protein PHPALM_19580 [Phytophthora palmivora]|uniref:GAF domain-containing protein n=1 Tax=Phytophthora palmivora TaxID=4796 RepID=A0A2P4XGZ9_9STRA|nr:Hypothetical protein PHPALM_19580 [Phytophthora palmivora]